ncbi:MAG: TonB family protein [Pseudomonadota bacterium]|nr:TonB family protein [Pseudomonadota bacterium]
MLERWQPQSQQRLALLLPLSLALHLPLLAYFSAPMILPVADSPASLSVRIVASSTDHQDKTEPAMKSESQENRLPQPEPEPAKYQPIFTSGHAGSTSHDKIKQVRSETVTTPEKHQDHQQTNRNSSQAEPVQAEPITNRAQVEQRLQQEMPNHFYYPRLARRQGYQGTVTLGIELHRQGYITEIQILKSSGYRILDLAAREAASRMAVGWASQLLHEPSMKIKLPVQYILTEG